MYFFANGYLFYLSFVAKNNADQGNIKITVVSVVLFNLGHYCVHCT